MKIMRKNNNKIIADIAAMCAVPPGIADMFVK